MKVYKIWLTKNKNIKPKYPYLDLNIIKKYEKLADIYKISEVSRGLKKSIKTEHGLLYMYKKVKGNSSKLSYIPIFKSNPSGQDYDSFREKFLNARIGQIKAGNVKLYYTNGPYTGLPTKQHLVLIMNAYSPDPKKLIKKMTLLNNL
jgi:hypothetical protein